MKYKSVFKIACFFISSPAKAWEDISLNSDKRNVVMDFVYPMIGFCGLSTLIGSLIRLGWNTPLAFQTSMIVCSGVAFTLFGGYFLSVYLINYIGVKMFGLSDNYSPCLQFVGYSMTMTFLTGIFIGFFPSLKIFCQLLELYVFYIVWQGASIIMGIEKGKRFSFTIITSIILLACPEFIQAMFNELISLFH